MSRNESIERRVRTALVGLTVLLGVAYGALGLMVAYITEDEIIGRLMAIELAYLRETYAESGALPQPRASYFRYFPSIDATPEPVANTLRNRPELGEVFTPDASHYHVRRLSPDGNPPGLLVAEVSPLLVVTNMSGFLLSLLGIAFALTLGVTVAIAWRLAGQLTRPIVELAGEVRQFSPGQVALTATQRGDELGYLATAIQGAVNKLDKALERESAFTRDVSHELRTPLTILKNALTLLESRPPGPDDIEVVGQAVEQLEQTTAVLLALARAESLQKESVHLRAVLEEQVLQHTAHLEVELEVAHDATLRTNPRLFSLLVDNLMENAWRYAAAPLLTVVFDDGRLSFRNTLVAPLPGDVTAPGIRDAASPGIGQGLFLVRRISEAMGWQMETRECDGSFCVVLEISP
jgi:signal transduction histidine kinase